MNNKVWQVSEPMMIAKYRVNFHIVMRTVDCFSAYE